MKETFILIVIVLFGINGFAQAPGYQGKKLSVECNYLFFPAFSSPGTGYYHGDQMKFYDKLFNFNKRYKISIDYVLNRRNSVGVGFEFFKSRFQFDPGFDYSIDNTYDWDYEYFQSDQALGNISAKGLNFHYTTFYNKSLAPLGKYAQLDFGIMVYNSTVDQEMLEDEILGNKWRTNDFIPELTENRNDKTIYFGLTFGKKRIFFDRLLVNSGFQFCYVPGAYTIIKDVLEINNDRLNEQTFLSSAGHKRIFKHMLFNLNLGVGFLIF
ncbi:MAG: hypothetical protein K9J13_17385 [Saprospiraceae bacterium]|nr:hypothetical protein [Saprospiraceae bacterium]